MDTTTLRPLGRHGLEVTPLGFGGGTIGSPAVSIDDSIATVRAAWASDVRFFDTAPWYGVGRSERRLGIALAEFAPPEGRREAFKVNTKIGKTLVPEARRDETKKTLSPGGEVRTVRDPRSGFRVEFGYTEARIRAQHHDSLQRLGFASVDSLTIHDIDYGYHDDAGIEGHLAELDRQGGGGARALEELRDDGAILAIGCGCNLESRNAASWEDSAHEDLMARIADRVDLDFLVVAGGYTLLETRALRRILPLCDERDISVVIAAPYASGWLADPDGASTYMYAPAPQEIVQKSLRMQSICREHGVALASVALQFVLAHPRVAAAIPGAKTPAETTANRAHLDVEIPQELWRNLKSEGLLDEQAPTP